MDEKCFNYYEKGTRIGNYSIFHNALVVDKDNRVLMSDESGRNEIHGFRDIIYCQGCGETEICSAQDFSIITILEGQLICLDSHHPHYCRIINEKGEIIKDNLTYDEMRIYINKNVINYLKLFYGQNIR